MWIRPVEPTVASPDDPPAPRQRVDRLELLGAILMAIAAVATAWSSYQATRWNGEQAVAASRTNAIRIDAARAGMSTKLSSRRLRGMMLVCGYTILGGALVWLALSPVSIRT
jgi:hypothetical protein